MSLASNMLCYNSLGSMASCIFFLWGLVQTFICLACSPGTLDKERNEKIVSNPLTLRVCVFESTKNLEGFDEESQQIVPLFFVKTPVFPVFDNNPILRAPTAKNIGVKYITKIEGGGIKLEKLPYATIVDLYHNDPDTIPKDRLYCSASFCTNERSIPSFITGLPKGFNYLEEQKTKGYLEFISLGQFIIPEVGVDCPTKLHSPKSMAGVQDFSLVVTQDQHKFLYGFCSNKPTVVMFYEENEETKNDYEGCFKDLYWEERFP